MAAYLLRNWQLGVVGFLTISGLTSGANRTLAQITPDATLGAEGSVVTPGVDIGGQAADRIDGGATRGINLFHSFFEFNVGERQQVYFANPTGIENILTRVTGTNASNILGTLGVTGGNAKLFVMNPNGIIFGENARLDVGSSFVATTANAIRFATGEIFSANSSSPLPTQILNVNPNAFFFNQIVAQPIINRSKADSTGLQVPQGQSLLLVGGNISLDSGRIAAPGGRVELGGAAGTGTIELSVDGNNLRLSFSDGVILSNVSLTNAADVNVRAGGGGSIAINAQNLNITGISRLRAGINPGLGAVDTQAGDVEINATATINLNDSLISSAVGPNAVGNSGNIDITAGSLSVTNGAQISTSTYGQGDAGNVNINARDTVSFDGVNQDGYRSGAYTIVEVEAVGTGGDISITTGTLSVTNTARLLADSYGQGDAGNVNINARDTVSFDGLSRRSNGFATVSGAFSNVADEAVGNGGNINIMTGSLSVTNGAELSARTYGQGDAGNVNINARDTVSFDGEPIYGYTSGVGTTVAQQAVGDGGDINITAGMLSVTNGARLNTITLGQGDAGSLNFNVRNIVVFDGLGSFGSYSGAYSNVRTGAVGQGGDINITAGVLSFTNGGTLSASTYGQGDGGNITLNTNILEALNDGDVHTISSSGGKAGNITINDAESVTLSDGGGLFASASETSTNLGGDLTINTGQLVVRDGAQVSVSSEGSGSAGSLKVKADSIFLDTGTLSSNTAGGQGNIDLQTGDLILRRGSSITTNATGRATGGNITIDTDNLIAVPKENSDISANAVESFGGRVIVNAQGIFGTEFRPRLTELSDITATSERGSQFNGTVELNTPDVDPSQGLAELPIDLVDATELVDSSCMVGQGSARSSSFTVTGRGGLPSNPTGSLSSDSVWNDLRLHEPPAKTNPRAGGGTQENNRTTGEIVEAQGWVKMPDGKVVLVAQSPSATIHNPWLTSPDCQDMRASAN